MSSEISKALRLMFSDLERQVTEATLEESLERSEKIAKAIDGVYQSFFQRVEEILEELEFDADENFSPGGGSPLSLATWKPLSEYWKEEKANYNGGVTLPFYQGITKFRRMQSFLGYVSSLARSKNSVNRFFGPSRIEYKVTKEGVGTSITYSSGKVRVKAENPTQQSESRKEYITSATVRVFPKLIEVVGRGRVSPETEWKVVDSMIKTGGSNRAYKQLVKINGRYGLGVNGRRVKNRPIRPLITPIIASEIRFMQNLVNRSLNDTR